MKRFTDEEFREKLNSVRPDLEALGEYRKAVEPMMFRCKLCGYEWESSWNAVSHQKRCPRCSGRERRPECEKPDIRRLTKRRRGRAQGKVNAVYARQSIDKKNSISIEGQIELCKSAAREDLKVYVDKGYSGKNTERPDFQRLMNDISDGQIGKLYVYRLDRFSRSIADFSVLWETLQKHNVEFVSVNENFDTTTPMGRAMLHIIMVFAQLERETIAERVRDNYYRRAALGAWPGGPAPFGMSIGRINMPDGKKASCLVMNEKSAIVLSMFEEYMKPGASLGSIARKLNSEGGKATGRPTWDSVAVCRILHSPVYVMADDQVYLHYKALGANVISPLEDFDGIHGILLVGKRAGGERKYTDVKGHRVSVMNSTGFVPSALWLACQRKLKNNRQIGCAAKATHSWLTGLMKCDKCGYSVRVLTERTARWLVCSGRYNLYRCDAKITVKIAQLEAMVSEEIEKILKKGGSEIFEEVEPDIFVKQLAELDRRANRLLDAFAENEDISTEYLHKYLAKIEKERQALFEARKKERKESICNDMQVSFYEMEFEEKKTIAAQLIECIKIKEDSVDICWRD